MPVNARVKAGLDGKEGPLCLYCFGSGEGALLGAPGLLALPCRASGEEPETELQERGQGGVGLEDEAAGQGCAITVLPEGEQSANESITSKLLPQAAAIEHLLTHFNIDPKEIPTFLLFFFKVQKALCCPRERIFGQAVQCKEKGGS